MAGLMPVLWESQDISRDRTSCLAMPVRIETASLSPPEEGVDNLSRAWANLAGARCRKVPAEACQCEGEKIALSNHQCAIF